MMSFGDAFRYPYKNLPKIAIIVLGFAIIIAVLFGLILNNSNSYGLIMITGAVVLAQSIFLTGYGIRIIRHIMDGNNEHMPKIEIVNDLGRGIIATIAGILTYIPLIAVVYFCMIAIVPQTMYGRSLEPSGYFLVAVCIALFLYLTCGYIVGMIRYAAEERRRALFQFFTNIAYVKSNKKTSLKLIGFSFIIGIIYMVATNATSFLYEAAVIDSLTYRTDQNIIIAVIAISTILTTTFNLLQQFSNLHLIAQYAEQIGITRFPADEKMKH